MSAAAAAAIRARLPLRPVPDCPSIRLHRATPASALGRLVAEAGDPERPPYWAYPWAGGLALARYLAERPEAVAGRRVLDLGSGSGLVAIAAALAGAAQVLASDSDPLARVAIALNAAANGVTIAVEDGDADSQVDLVVAGDVFYDAHVVLDTLGRLDRLAALGAAVLVGDPWRPALPVDRLRERARYTVHETDGRAIDSGVFAFGPAIR